MEGEKASDSLCTSEESLEGARATPMDQCAHPSIHVWKKTEILTQKGWFVMLRHLVDKVESEEESQVMHSPQTRLSAARTCRMHRYAQFYAHLGLCSTSYCFMNNIFVTYPVEEMPCGAQAVVAEK